VSRIRVVIFLAMILVSSVLLLACKTDGTRNLEFESHVFRNVGVGDHKHIAKFMDLKELQYYLDEHGIYKGEFYEFLTKYYTNDFFAQNYILFLTITGSGADSFIIEKITSNGYIHITKSSGVLTNIESWKIIIELSRITASTAFQIKLNEI